MEFANVEDNLRDVIEQNISYMNPILSMTEEIMEAAGIHE